MEGRKQLYVSSDQSERIYTCKQWMQAWKPQRQIITNARHRSKYVHREVFKHVCSHILIHVCCMLESKHLYVLTSVECIACNGIGQNMTANMYLKIYPQSYFILICYMQGCIYKCLCSACDRSTCAHGYVSKYIFFCLLHEKIANNN